MITALQSATLLDEVELPDGNKTKVTEKMLCSALAKIYEKQDHTLMNLSEVRMFYSIDMRERHWDREP
eukprot:12908362-Prorocentrum_lima.AAC.1